MIRNALIDPLRLVATLFILQASIWYFGMPDIPIIHGAASRYFSLLGAFRYALIFIFLILGIVSGKLFGTRRRLQNSRPLQSAHVPFKRLELIGLVALILAFVGQLIYIRAIVLNPQSVFDAMEGGGVGRLGSKAREDRIPGLSSLNNLFILGVAAYSVIAFHKESPPNLIRRARLLLFLVGIAVAAHALFLAARMFAIYYFAVVVGAYLLLRPKEAKGRHAVIICITVLCLLWIGETLKGGMVYARERDKALLSAETQQVVFNRLLEAYFASDFNNAMILLSSNPSMQVVSTTGLGRYMDFDTYSTLPLWTSTFGTANAISLWWWDCGLFATLVAFVHGTWLGYTFKKAQGSIGEGRVSALYYLISYPGIYSLIRINFFSLTIFILPLLCLASLHFLMSFADQRGNLRATTNFRPQVPKAGVISDD